MKLTVIVKKLLRCLFIFAAWCLWSVFLITALILFSSYKGNAEFKSLSVALPVELAVQRGLQMEERDYMSAPFVSPSRLRKIISCRPDQLPFKDTSEFGSCLTFEQGKSRRRSGCDKIIYFSSKCANFKLPEMLYRDKRTWEKVKHIMADPFRYLYDPKRCAEKGKANSAYLGYPVGSPESLDSGECFPTEEVTAYVHIYDENWKFVTEEKVVTKAIKKAGRR